MAMTFQKALSTPLDINPRWYEAYEDWATPFTEAHHCRYDTEWYVFFRKSETEGCEDEVTTYENAQTSQTTRCNVYTHPQGTTYVLVVSSWTSRVEEGPFGWPTTHAEDDIRYITDDPAKIIAQYREADIKTYGSVLSC